MKTKSNISRKNILRCIKNADRKKERNAAKKRYDKHQYDNPTAGDAIQ